MTELRGHAYSWGAYNDANGDLIIRPDLSAAERLDIHRKLRAEALEALGPGEKYEIRSQRWNYGLSHGLAWVEGWLSPSDDWTREFLHYGVGRYITGQEPPIL